MADYIAITDEEIEPEAPLTSSKLVRLRDNLIALAEGDNEAPRVKPQIFHVAHAQTSGVDGDNLLTGVWNGRSLNGVITNTVSGASLSGGLITLPGGVYDVEISVPVTSDTGVNIAHQSILQNDTDAVTTLIGTSEQAGPIGTTRSLIVGRVTIAVPKNFQIQTRVTEPTQGGVRASSGAGTEIYTLAKFTKVG